MSTSSLHRTPQHSRDRSTIRQALALVVSILLMTLGLVSIGSAVSAQSVRAEGSPGDGSTLAPAVPGVAGHPSGDPSTPPPKGETPPPEGETPPPEEEAPPVLVCLATGDVEAPYTMGWFSAQSIINGRGMVLRDGPANSPVGVFPAEGWGNIVPPVTHKSGKTFAGLNFGEDGRAFWDEDCKDPNPSSPPPHEGEEHELITVCMATDDDESPYLLKQYKATDLIMGTGQPKREGPANSPVGVFPAETWGNIVPPVTHPSGKQFAGLNWGDDGQRIWNAECVYTAPTPPPPPPPPPAPAPAPVAPTTEVVATPVATPEQTPTPTPTPVDNAYPGFIAVVDEEEADVETDAATVVQAPEAATVPAAVNAGGGSTAPPGVPVWTLLLMLAGVLGVIGSVRSLRTSSEE